MGYISLEFITSSGKGEKILWKRLSSLFLLTLSPSKGGYSEWASPSQAEAFTELSVSPAGLEVSCHLV